MEKELVLTLSIPETELMLKSLNFYTTSIALKIKQQAENQLNAATAQEEKTDKEG